MKNLHIILTIILIFITRFQLSAQTTYNPEEKFEVEKLQEDFKVLKKNLETIHVGLYRYSSKETIDSLFNSSYRQISGPMTEIEFYRIANKIVTAIRDEHTFALPSEAYWSSQIGQTVYYNSADKGDASLFPFFIRIIGNKLFIDNNLSDDLSLKRGDEILQINGYTAQEVLGIVLPTIHTNGYIETFRKRNLEQFSMHQTYNRFMVHYALFIGMPDNFTLKIKRYASDQTETVQLAALTSKDIYEHYWKRYSTVNDAKKHKEDPMEFVLLDNKTFQPYQYHEVNNYRFPDLKAYFTDPKAFPTSPDELFTQQKNGTFRSNPQ